MDNCEDCNTRVNPVYCNCCSKTLCTKCRHGYLCIDCKIIEDEDQREKELISRLKPILIPMKEHLQFRDYWKIVNMIKFWTNGRISQGDNIMAELRGAFLPAAHHLLDTIERIVIENEDPPEHIVMPTHFYQSTMTFRIH